MRCPVCGTDNAPGEDFCGNCGLALDSTNANAPTVVTPVKSASPVNTGPTVVYPTTSPGITGMTGGSGKLAPNMALQNGRYVIEKVLGEGGMGTAALARDTRVANKRVVVKELITDSSDPTKLSEDVDNFNREVATLASLNHPSIPDVTDSFQEGSRYFMIQEYVPGENLEAYIDRLQKPLPEREVLTYALQVLDIIDYLAQQNPPIIHRDIKPANIIIGASNKKAHLVDFGIARADVNKYAKRKQTSALGTQGYAPPEQYSGNADTRSDLYALAATMHHLLTNRDPRNYPPFNFPDARTLNPQLSVETEKMLKKALTIDASKRYQSVGEMRKDIQDILRKNYNMGRNTMPQRGTATQGGQASRPAAKQPVTPPPVTPPPVQPVSPPKKESHWVRNSLLLLVVLGVILFAIIGVPRLFPAKQGASPGTTPTAITQTEPTANATPTPGEKNVLGVETVDGQLIGISDGSTAFDLNRPSGPDKKAAAEKLKAGDVNSAQSLWRAALGKDSSDAEVLINLENQRVLDSGKPYVTIVVGTMLTGAADNIQAGRDQLQGAYVAQKEFNQNNGARLGGKLVRLLIANGGDSDRFVPQVANQIVELAKNDPTVVGVMGWPYSAHAQAAIRVLGKAQVPMITGTASSDDLTGVSPYFFRVAPSNQEQAKVAAKYAKSKMNAKNVVVFQDPANTYSRSLAESFMQEFRQEGGTILGPVSYTLKDETSISQALDDALQLSPAPDMIYFAGYSDDVSVLLKDLPEKPNTQNLQILGGDALYNLGGYPANNSGFNRLRFTAFAYPDEWDVLGHGSQKPSFYKDYPDAFDPNRRHQGSPYGFTRPAFNVVLGYDAMLALLSACENATKGGTNTLTPEVVKDALTQITGTKAIQGASGQISFGADGNPLEKPIVMLRVNERGQIQMESQLGSGKLLVGE